MNPIRMRPEEMDFSPKVKEVIDKIDAARDPLVRLWVKLCDKVIEPKIRSVENKGEDFSTIIVWPFHYNIGPADEGLMKERMKKQDSWFARAKASNSLSSDDRALLQKFEEHLKTFVDIMGEAKKPLDERQVALMKEPLKPSGQFTGLYTDAELYINKEGSYQDPELAASFSGLDAGNRDFSDLPEIANTRADEIEPKAEALLQSLKALEAEQGRRLFYEAMRGVGGGGMKAPRETSTRRLPGGGLSLLREAFGEGEGPSGDVKRPSGGPAKPRAPGNRG